MMYGFVEWDRKTGMWVIKVEGFSQVAYMFYTKRQAIARYRVQKGLQRRRIHWIESDRVSPSSGVEDALKYLESLSKGGNDNEAD